MAENGKTGAIPSWFWSTKPGQALAEETEREVGARRGVLLKARAAAQAKHLAALPALTAAVEKGQAAEAAARKQMTKANDEHRAAVFAHLESSMRQDFEVQAAEVELLETADPNIEVTLVDLRDLKDTVLRATSREDSTPKLARLATIAAVYSAVEVLRFDPEPDVTGPLNTLRASAGLPPIPVLATR